MRHPKHTAIGQWCEYGERRFYARSRAEARHAAVLEMQRKAGVIADWRHEPKRFLFPDRTVAPLFFLPDFSVTKLDGSIEYQEIKGHWQSKDRSRIVLFARHYPEIEVRFFGALPDIALCKRIEAARGVGVRELEKMERREARKRRGA